MYLLFTLLIHCKRLLLACLLLLLSTVGNASLVPGEHALWQGAEYFSTEQTLDIEQLATADFQPFTHDQVNQGINSRKHWLRFRVSNPHDADLDWVIRGETSYLDHLVLYTREAGQSDYQITRLSDRVAFTERPLDYRSLSYAHSTAGHSQTDIYLLAYHDQADSISLGFDLMTQADFSQRQRLEHLGFGLFYGVLLTLILLAIFFAVLLKQTNALNYALFLTFTVLLWLKLNGLGFQYLWPGNVYWHNDGFHLVYLGFCFFALAFSKQFLQLRRLSPGFYRFFQGFQLIIVLAVVLRLFGLYAPVLYLSFMSLALLALVIPTASALVWRRGLHYGLWSLIAWLFYSAGLLACVISASTNLFPWGMSPLLYLQAGSLIETFFLMIGMAKWLVAMERDRQRALALAHEDPLTGLGNRRRLQSAFEGFQSNDRQRTCGLFLIMIDLDHFKVINDTYGHDAGDAVLRDVSNLLQQVCRKEDVATRYGGEEFALLIHADTLEDACQVAERVRTRFANTPTRYRGEVIEHTLCCGIAAIPDNQHQWNVREMMRHADAALYHAKSQGRNQNHVFTPGLVGAN